MLVDMRKDKLKITPEIIRCLKPFFRKIVAHISCKCDMFTY